MVKQVSIGEVFEFVRNGASIKQEDNKSGYPITRIETIWNETIDDSRFGYADIFDKDLIKYEKYLLEIGDILMTHINSQKHLGKSAMYNGLPENLIHGMNLLCLRPNKKISDSKYLKHYLNSSYFKELLPKISNQSVNQASFSAGNLKSLEIPLPPLPQQQKIANILDAADALRQNDKALIAKYDELTQALFLNMFGDPVSNPKGWKKVSLSEYGSFKNGLNFNNSESGVSLKYLGVGDFKSKSRIDDVESLSNIQLNSLPNVGYLLNDGDLVFVRSNGNRALVGRCVEVYPQNTKLTFSGFCIRYRINSHFVKPTYLSQLFRNKSFKNLMLESGQGANIQNINQQILSSIDVPLPSLNLQEQFVESIQAIEQQKAIAQKSLEKSEELFNSLLQKAFKGELTNL